MFDKIAKKRRSIRKFQPRPVAPEKIDIILEAALRAPTARRKRSWQFIVVTDEAVRTKLSKARPSGGQFLESAPVAVVVCGNPEVSPHWIADCSIAAVSMQYAATSLDLGSCWFNIRGNERQDGTPSGDHVKALMHLPENLDVLCIIALGHPDESPAPYDRDTLPWDNVSYGRYE